MSFNYTTGIPAANNNPSTDQPDMLENNDSNYNIWDVDHYTFNNGLGLSGQHLQLQFPAKVSPVPTAAGSASAFYTLNGVANTTAANINMVNSAGTFPGFFIKAYGLFALTSVPGITVQSSQSFNIDTGTLAASGGGLAPFTFTIPLTAGVVTGNDIGVIVSIPDSLTASFPSFFGVRYSFTNPNLTVTTSLFSGTKFLTVCILQI